MANEKLPAQYVTHDDSETTQQQQSSVYPSQSFPSSVRRKPVAATTSSAAGTVSAEQPLPPLPPTSSKPETAQPSTHPPPLYIPTTTRTTTSKSRSKVPAFYTRLQTRWTLLRKRTKIILICSLILLLLILIIGLAAGLSTRHNGPSNLPLPSSHGGPYTGDLTYYAPGLGACGVTSSSTDSIVAVSHLLFDAVSTGSNPNANPLCGKKIRARRNDRSVDLTVVDRCVGCQARDLDVTETIFAQLASVDQGRVSVEWAWLEDVPASGS